MGRLGIYWKVGKVWEGCEDIERVEGMVGKAEKVQEGWESVGGYGKIGRCKKVGRV